MKEGESYKEKKEEDVREMGREIGRRERETRGRKGRENENGAGTNEGD